MNRRAFLFWLAGADALAIVAALAMASVIHYSVGRTLLPAYRDIVVAISMLPIQLLFFRLIRLYEFDEILAGTLEYGRIALAACYSVLLVAGVSFFAGGFPIVSRTWLLLVWMFVVLFVCAIRFAGRRIVRGARKARKLRIRVMIVGASASGVSVARDLTRATDQGIEVVGFVDEFAPLGMELLPGIQIVGRPADLARNPTAFHADQYVLVVDALPHQRLDELSIALLTLKDSSVRLTVGSLGMLPRQTLLARHSRVRLVALGRAEISGFNAVFKFAFDITVSLLALTLLTVPALAALAIAVLRGKHELVRIQHVYGRDGTEFRLPLLGHEVSGLLPLRGVPALLKVLAGKLSVVGPRPQPRDNSAPPLALQLTAIKPGLTGPWRFSGPDATIEEQAQDDLAYVHTYTPWEDVRLVLETLRHAWAPRIRRWEPRLRPGEDLLQVAALDKTGV